MTRAAGALSRSEERSLLLSPLAEARNGYEAGGKAANLARLIDFGLSVPPGQVLTRAAFDLFLSPFDLGRRLDAVCTDIDACTPERLADIADRARALIAVAPFPVAVEVALQAIADRSLVAGPLVVRSSAIGEDGATSSFAGQFDSVLGVTSLAALRDAVRACYASYWSARALFYRRMREPSPQKGVPRAERGMAVVIQQQVTPVAAGVLFTRNPDSQPCARGTMVIEYCAGLADRLVNGQIDPGRIVVSRATGAIVTHDTEHGVDEAARAVVANRLGELARLAVAVEQRLGTPQDIEWAIDAAGHVWFVQTRPITTRFAHTDTLQTDEILWTNANVSENFPYPISPLLYSIASLGYYHYFRNLGLAFGVSRRRIDAMDRPLRGIIGVHGARMYYNLTNIHAVLRMAPFGDRLTAAFNTFVGAREQAQAPPGMVSWGDRRARVSQWAELARIAIATTWQYMFLKRRIRAFECMADAFGERTRHERLHGATLVSLGALLAEFVDIRCRRWKNASLADAAAMVTFALLERVLARAGCDAAAHTRLLRALPDVPSSIPPRRLWSLSRMIRQDRELRSLFAPTTDSAAVLAAIRNNSRFSTFRRELDVFLEDWGFRSSAELMLTVPALDEQPKPAIDLLRQYALEDGESPELTIAHHAEERCRETSHVLRTLLRRSPLRAAAVWLLLRWTQRSIACRERARLKQALLYTRCRRVALCIGDVLTDRGQLPSRDEVFMLTYAEIEELVMGRAMFPDGVADLVALRRHQHARQSALNPPDTFELPVGKVFAPGIAMRRAESDHDNPADPQTVLSGTSACGGRVSARAAVLPDMNEAGRLRRRDVLVTRQTDPGWAPVFCLISGLVIERGGMLSHGAIIAREFGLPCVVGVKDATRRIPHGAAISVDGNRGQCFIGAES